MRKRKNPSHWNALHRLTSLSLFHFSLFILFSFFFNLITKFPPHLRPLNPLFLSLNYLLISGPLISFNILNLPLMLTCFLPHWLWIFNPFICFLDLSTILLWLLVLPYTFNLLTPIELNPQVSIISHKRKFPKLIL